jgi:hypothetical protein
MRKKSERHGAPRWQEENEEFSKAKQSAFRLRMTFIRE